MDYEKAQQEREQALDERRDKIGFDAQQGDMASESTRYAERPTGLQSTGGLNAHLLTEADAEQPDLAPEFKAQDHNSDVPEYRVRVRLRLDPSSSSGLQGIEIIWADQTTTYIRGADLMDGFDKDADSYWSLVLNVVNGKFDKVVTNYDATEDIFEDDGGSPPKQTKYRFRLVTQGLDAEGDPITTPISMYGQYREVTTCINGEPFQRLTKVT